MKQHDGFIKNRDVNVLLSGGGHKPLSDFLNASNFKTINGQSLIGTGDISVSSSTAWSNISGKPFNWSGQGGQPTWLWGSNDGSNYYVWNPSNFRVSYANSAGSVAWANVSGRPFEGALSNYPNWGFNPLGNTDLSWITGFAVYHSGLSSDWGCLRYYLSRNTPNGGGLSVCMDIDGSICTPGQIYSGTGFVSGSDRKLKYNIDYITDKKLLPIKKFNKISNGVQSYGFVAQELEDVGHRELVIDGSESKAVDYNAALSLCIALLSNIMFDKHLEIDSRINLLEKRILDLELENQDLRKRLND